MPENYCIQFERSGGFMGQIVTGEICSNELTSADRQKLDSLIQQSDIFNYKPEDTLSPGFPDQYEYVLNIDGKNNKQSLKFNDSNLPDQYLPLINYICRYILNKNKRN